MIHQLNILHLMLGLGAAGCLWLALREVRGRAMPLWHLALLPLLSAIMAFVFLLFFLTLHWPHWMFAAALLVGLAIGAARGFTMDLKFDHTWSRVRPKGRRVLLWVALILVAAVVVEISGALAGPVGMIFRLAAAEVAALCAGLLIGRALTIAVRVWHLPHVELRR